MQEVNDSTNENGSFLNVAASFSCSSKNIHYIYIVQERTNVHSLLLNVMKNHGQVVNPLKSWSKTRVCTLVLDKRMCNICRALFTGKMDIEFNRYNIHHDFYTLGHNSDVTSDLPEKGFNSCFVLLLLKRRS